ncbi:MAG TPA: phage minor head protein [Methylococcus sp.]|nr:phage minor head protein [Methylococcus sp.]
MAGNDPDFPSSRLQAVFKRPFAEQVAFFRGKLGNLIPTERWTDVWKSQHDTGFMVAGAMKADLLADLAAAVDRIEAEGKSIDAFRKDFDAIVERHGWAYRGERNWRTRVIYATNASTSYAAGRLAQLREGNFRFWIYRHSDSVLHPRPLHLAWDGLTLPADDPFWKTHAPPNGWGCRCYLLGARSEAGAGRLGGDPDKPVDPSWNEIDPKTGEPVGIDKGWGYMPGETVVDTVRQMARKIEKLPALLGARLGGDISRHIAGGFRSWLDEVRTGRRHDSALVGTLHRYDVAELIVRGYSPESAEILVKPGLILGPKAKRHADAGDALSDSQWDTLPERLLDPIAVLFDRKNGSLIYVLPGEDRAPQLAIRTDVQFKKPKTTSNLIVSAYRPKMDDLRQRIARGDLELLRGKIE